MKAVIMTDGRMNELHPFTSSVPKSMLPLLQKPILEYMLSWLKQHHIYEMVIIGFDRLSHLYEYFGDGRKMDCDLTYLEVDPEFKRVDSFEWLRKITGEPIVFLNDVCLTDMNLKEAIQVHMIRKSSCTLLTKESVKVKEKPVMTTTNTGQIVQVHDDGMTNQRVPIHTINTDIYIIESNWIDSLKTLILNGFNKVESPIYGCYVAGYWRPIKAIHHYRQAQKDLMYNEFSDRVC
ncbi:nucleotidyltransferase family protein [Halalkalibacter hemicellulosilyticus]|uniref:Mannose-1-phosphate guanylyltransferase n=1 Tax=Halalkalibacter hemicellulosilyticusJCM 9152 TaxID=1236971 RepID=W4QF41_9BACI|nr:NDP-sugar synthase [Halalkalibacter hemicellulosilyticus]GAE30725.1 mannose-1-phosphate guanylyltransferase [Halalkalibacter hemicellulosilyticusJCM 9152]